MLSPAWTGTKGLSIAKFAGWLSLRSSNVAVLRFQPFRLSLFVDTRQRFPSSSDHDGALEGGARVAHLLSAGDASRAHQRW